MSSQFGARDDSSATISQRELRNHSAAVMDRLEAGESFTITRAGRAVGRLIPLRGPQEGVPLEQFVAAFANIRPIDGRKLRAEMDQFFADDGDRVG